MEIKTRVAGIIIRDNKLLMLKGKWHEELWTPGGKIEPGESDEECLRRELKEEIGVKILEMKFFKKYSGMSFYHKNRITKQRIYIVSISGEPKPDSEIEKIIWLSRGDFNNKKYSTPPVTEEEIIPDLIEHDIF